MAPFDLSERAFDKNKMEEIRSPFDKHLSTQKDTVGTTSRQSKKTSSGHHSFVPISATRRHKVGLEIPFRYENQSGSLSLRQTSRLNVHSSFPLYDTKRQHVACHVSGTSALRGKTGYTTGSASVKLSHRHGADAGTSSRCTSLTTGLGLAPKSGVVGSSIPNSSSPAVHLGLATTAQQTSVSANLNFPKPTTDPSLCLLSVSASAHLVQRPAHVRTQCSATMDPDALRSINMMVSISPVQIGSMRAAGHHRPQQQQQQRQHHQAFSSIKPNWNLRLGCSKLHQETKIRPSVGFSASIWVPKLYKCSRKLLGLSAQWKGGAAHTGGGWQLEGMWTNKTDPSTKARNRQIGVGVTMNSAALSTGTGSAKNSSTGMFSWIFSWTEGDFTLRVPVLLCTSSAAASAFYYQHAFQLFYLTFLASIVQDVIAVACLPDATKEEHPEERNRSAAERQSAARQEALIQQGFMKRQAKQRMSRQKERDGLVIRRALYSLRRGSSDGSSDNTTTDENSFDVTIPLQFWVSPTESKLELFENTRSGMLGFYDITATHRIVSEEPAAAGAAKERSLSEWIRHAYSFWFNTERRQTKAEPKIEAVQPELTIWYDFAGRSYEITVGDQEAVTLPSFRARQIVEQ